MAKKAKPVDEMFDRYFYVQFSYFHSRTTEQLRRNGMRSSGIPELDERQERQLVESYLSVDGIFEHFRKGVNVRVMNYADTAEIYRIVHSHLTVWRSYLSGAIHPVKQELLEELIELDRFATVVYSKAVSVFSDQERERLKNPNIPLGQKINLTNIFKRDINSTITNVTVDASGKQQITKAAVRAADKPGLKERHTYQDMFAEHLSNGNWIR